MGVLRSTTIINGVLYVMTNGMIMTLVLSAICWDISKFKIPSCEFYLEHHHNPNCIKKLNKKKYNIDI